MSHIIVTGPESSGKTSLCRYLSQKLPAILLPEYPYSFLKAAGRGAIATDFEHFQDVNTRLLQLARNLRSKASQPNVIVQDTGIENLLVWANDKFPNDWSFLKEALDKQKPDLYLICLPDLPWEAGPFREDPHRRQELLDAFLSVLAAQSSPLALVEGHGDERFKLALDHIRAAGIQVP